MTYMAVGLLFSIIEDTINTNNQNRQLKQLLVDLVKTGRLTLYSSYGFLTDTSIGTVRGEQAELQPPQSILNKLQTAPSIQTLRHVEDQLNKFCTENEMSLRLKHINIECQQHDENYACTGAENEHVAAYDKLHAVKRVHERDLRIPIDSKKNTTLNIENYFTLIANKEAPNHSKPETMPACESHDVQRIAQLPRQDPFPTPPLSIRINIRNFNLLNDDQAGSTQSTQASHLLSAHQQIQIWGEQVLRSWRFTDEIPQEVDQNFLTAQSRSLREAKKNALLKNQNKSHDVSRTTVTPKGFTRYLKDIDLNQTVCCGCDSFLIDSKPWFLRMCGHVYCRQCISDTGRCLASHCRRKNPSCVELFI